MSDPRAVALLAALLVSATGSAQADGPWALHTIDNSSRGADGVKVADINGDGLQDIATGWEEGGITRIYVHPGPANCTKAWPRVTVGSTPNAEDAVFADLDGDGHVDVVSACEGATKAMFIHWSPSEAGLLLDESAWRTERLPNSQGVMMWMYAEPVQIDGRAGLDVLAGGKGPGGAVGWFGAPPKPRLLADWSWHPISECGWIMSLLPVDMDGDGDPDALLTDRKGELRGCRWLENPGAGPAQVLPWRNHWVGVRGAEAMFMAHADLDGDGQKDIACSTAHDGLMLFRRVNQAFSLDFTILSPDPVLRGKGVGIGDLDLDGRADLVWSFEGAREGRSGVIWLSRSASDPQAWTWHELSGSPGIKFDQVVLTDIDQDGDLDVLTCEEREPRSGKPVGLGVVWYENPTRTRAR